MTIAQLMKRIDARFKTSELRMTSRFDAVEARFDAVDKRFDAMGAVSDARFARVDRNIEALGEKLDTITSILHERCNHQEKIATEHEDRLRDLERAAGR